MIVYVITKAEIMREEIYVTVKATKKDAEKYIRNLYPNARQSDTNNGWSYLCKIPGTEHFFLMFIHVETI